jgi:hypothetical protein
MAARQEGKLSFARDFSMSLVTRLPSCVSVCPPAIPLCVALALRLAAPVYVCGPPVGAVVGLKNL